MKGSATVDYDRGEIAVDVTLHQVEDAGDAIHAIKTASRMLWPDIVFEGEPGFDEAVGEPAAKGKAS